jgi:class 3 adenylate cyclase
MKKPHDRYSPSFSLGPIKRRGDQPASKPAAPPAIGPGQDAGEPAPAAAPAPSAAGTLRQWAGGPKATLAIVFTDIVSSTALGNKLGNRAMDELRRAHFRCATEQVNRYGGRVVKTIGDSVLAAFHAASDALDFASAVNCDPGDDRIQVRAGLHVGPVTVEENDVYGATVNYAARVAAAPKDAEVWLSSEAKSHVDQEGAPHQTALRWLNHAGLEIKGFPGKHILWSLVTR